MSCAVNESVVRSTHNCCLPSWGVIVNPLMELQQISLQSFTHILTLMYPIFPNCFAVARKQLGIIMSVDDFLPFAEELTYQQLLAGAWFLIVKRKTSDTSLN